MVKKKTEATKSLSSSGHRLGQIIGDWWETKVLYTLLGEVADSLKLFLDNRIVHRSCRSGKVLWCDLEDNVVDYDFVLELGGKDELKGIPVAFFETFWRRGARHSKDKARDDTNKLLPMRDTYPTARFLAIAACGEFTEPARDYVRSRNVELFFISKDKIVEAFDTVGIKIDYPDSLGEDSKNQLVNELQSKFNTEIQNEVANNLRNIVGHSTFNAFKQRIIGGLSATPQEIRISSLNQSGCVRFKTLLQAEHFLADDSPEFPSSEILNQYIYEVTFSDGSEFRKTLSSLESSRLVNGQLLQLVKHMESL